MRPKLEIVQDRCREPSNSRGAACRLLSDGDDWAQRRQKGASLAALCEALVMVNGGWALHKLPLHSVNK